MTPTTISWDPLSDATAHDVVRGDLVALRTSGADYSVSTSECLANDYAGTAIAYGDGSTSQVGSPDPGIDSSFMACP